MKTKALLVVAAVLVGVATSASVSPNAVSLSVDVEQLSSHYEKWRSEFGTFVTRETLNCRVAEAHMRYFGQGTLPVRVEFYLIGRDYENGLLIYHYHSKDAVLKSGVTVDSTTVSGILVANKKHVTDGDVAVILNAHDEVTGIQPFGWVVKVFDKRDGKQLIAVASNNPDSIPQLPQLVAKMGPEKMKKLQESAEKRIVATLNEP